MSKDNRFNIDLFSFAMYIFKSNDLKIAEELKAVINSKSVPETYAGLMCAILLDLYDNNQLFEDYVEPATVELPYICGVIDIQKSISLGSFSRNAVYQKVKKRSINIPVNLCIKYCLDTILTYRHIKSNADFCRFVSNKLYNPNTGVFKGQDKFILSSELTSYYSDIAHFCIDSDFYSCYRPILGVCVLYLDNLIGAGVESIDDLDEDNDVKSLFDVGIETLMQLFLETAFRHVMLSFSRNEKYRHLFNGNWRMQKKDKYFKEAGVQADIVVRFNDKKCNLKHLIVDCKTNHSIVDKRSYSHQDNINQIHKYTHEYTESVSPNCAGVLFHFLNKDASNAELALDNTLVSTSTKLEMYIWVYKLMPDTKPQEVEDWLRCRLIDFFGLNKEF